MPEFDIFNVIIVLSMKTIIVAKMSCDDSILKSSQKFGAAEIKDMVSAAFTFTPFIVTQVELVYARISEKYFSACKKLGYDNNFFRDYTIMALCKLDLHGCPDFDGIYVPFSGEIYLIPAKLFEVKPVEIQICSAVLKTFSEGEFLRIQKRSFDVQWDEEEETPSRWKKFKSKIIGQDIPDINGRRILSLKAREDVDIKMLDDDIVKQDKYEPMYFLYNE